MLITADDYLPIARRFEGDIPWLYLDTVNKVTIGIGHLIPTAAAVAAIPLARDGRAASDADKQTAYAAVAAAKDRALRGANAFKDLSDLRITPDQSAALFRDKFAEIFAEAQRLFRTVGGGFAAWPKPVQLATFDMAYNLGPQGLFSGFPTFRTKGLAVGDYQVCAEECRRIGPAPARNAWTRDQFEAAAQEARR
ncbi:hypothetical protein [Thalassobaculum sp.]|uniref:hypothetical protein n=1 Tax=Thalassobaculum sp. TaxID=2022740 RepID=UPI003B5AC4C7